MAEDSRRLAEQSRRGGIEDQQVPDPVRVIAHRNGEPGPPGAIADSTNELDSGNPGSHLVERRAL